MTEAGMRKFHRRWGVVLLPFLAVQALAGLLLAVSHFTGEDAFMKTLAAIHTDWDPVGSVYRIILGLAVLTQGVTGFVIFLLVRSRQKKA